LPLGVGALATLILVGMTGCGQEGVTSLPTATAPVWADASPASLFLTPIDITYRWNEVAESDLELPVLAIDRSGSSGRFSHHWPENDATLLGMVEKDGIDITGIALVVSTRQGTRQWLADLVEVVTNQQAGVESNIAASIVDELDDTGDESIVEYTFGEIRFRYEERASGHWLFAIPVGGGDPGLLREGDAFLSALREGEGVAQSANERRSIEDAFMAVGFSQDGDRLSSPSEAVRLDLRGSDELTRVVYSSDLSSEDEVAEGLLVLTSALDGLADGAGTWVYEQITNRAIDVERVDDAEPVNVGETPRSSDY